MTFESVMELTRTISSHTAFEDEECRAYYDLLCALEPLNVIVEIGCQFGRSSSIALQVGYEKMLDYVGIDPFIDPPDARKAWVKMASNIGGPWRLLVKRSEECRDDLPALVHLALIDGDHREDAIRIDCQLLMPRITIGGHLLLHDYGRESLPDVYPTVKAQMVEAIMAGKHWEELPTVGCLGIWRKVA
jgi:cephalosporin hydroxylase